MNEFDRMRRDAEINKRLYPPGTRIELIKMNDPYAPVEPLTTGTVVAVDDAGTEIWKINALYAIITSKCLLRNPCSTNYRKGAPLSARCRKCH